MSDYDLQLRAAQALERMATSLDRIDATLQRLSLPVAPQEFEPDRDEVVPKEPSCPSCNEPDKIEDTSAPDAPMRRTCLSCGTSWRLALREVTNGC